MQTEVTLAQILVRVEEQLSGRPITLVGEGTGAILSLYLAAAGTLLIDAMALLDPIIELSALEKILSRGSITDKAFSWRNQRSCNKFAMLLEYEYSKFINTGGWKMGKESSYFDNILLNVLYSLELTRKDP
jgi:alpha-beta hydrolase superfamily lysophospholipase